MALQFFPTAFFLCKTNSYCSILGSLDFGSGLVMMVYSDTVVVVVVVVILVVVVVVVVVVVAVVVVVVKVAVVRWYWS